MRLQKDNNTKEKDRRSMSELVDRWPDLMKAVALVYESMMVNGEEPGAEEYWTSPVLRGDLVARIGMGWARLEERPSWAFPYSEYFTHSAFIRFRKLNVTDKPKYFKKLVGRDMAESK